MDQVSYRLQLLAYNLLRFLLIHSKGCNFDFHILLILDEFVGGELCLREGDTYQRVLRGLHEFRKEGGCSSHLHLHSNLLVESIELLSEHATLMSYFQR